MSNNFSRRKQSSPRIRKLALKGGGAGGQSAIVSDPHRVRRMWTLLYNVGDAWAFDDQPGGSGGIATAGAGAAVAREGARWKAPLRVAASDDGTVIKTNF